MQNALHQQYKRKSLILWLTNFEIKFERKLGIQFFVFSDEALDLFNKEYMVIILWFVDCKRFVTEQFFDIVNVPNTTSQTLKNEICKVLGKCNLLVENMCGQGYDSAYINGLQALFLQECLYAYYVYCFAHRLQLALIGVAEKVTVVWRFFSLLIKIKNFVGSSTKCAIELKLTREDEIVEFLDVGYIAWDR